MARRAARLLFAVVLAAALLHPDVAEKAPGRPESVVPYYRCGACKVDATEVPSSLVRLRQFEVNVTNARSSPVNKVPEMGHITRILDNVCNPQLDFEDEKGPCNEECTNIITSAWPEVMKHDLTIFTYIKDERPSIQKLMEYLCIECPLGAEGADGNRESNLETMIKKFGRSLKEMKNLGHKSQKTEEPTNVLKRNCNEACTTLVGVLN